MKNTWDYIIYDFETGGLSYEKHAITQIALIVLSGDTLVEKERFTTFVQNYDNLQYEPQALKMTGITMTQINSGMSVENLVKSLKDVFIRNTNGKGRYKRKPILVAHNGDNFDIFFMRKIFQFCDADLYEFVERHTEDTMWLARNAWQHEEEDLKYNLGACCEKAGVKLVDAHDAMNDVIATSDLFKVLLNKTRNSSQNQEINNSFYREKIEFKF